MTEPTPRWIGRYQVREVIGTGAFATVYRALDEHLDADVAIKVLAENHSLDPDVRQRFIEEGRRLRRFRSPDVVPVHDLGETDGAQPYLVLEWADGGDLGRRVAERRREGLAPGPSDVLRVARPVAAALRLLHRQGVVHRDLTPGNLLLVSAAPAGGGAAAPGVARPLVGGEEQLKLTDLGLSKDLAAASGLTAGAGTSGFAPPEQRRPGAAVDQRADVWAASALMVWLVLDRPPDEGGRWRRELRSTGWPTALDGALQRGLADRPDRRQPDIDAWLADLEEALGRRDPDADPAAARSSAGDRPPGSSAPRPRGAARWVGAVVAAVVAGGAAGATVASWGGDMPAARTERLAGGDLRTVVEDRGITIELEGPTETAVGEPVQVAAEVDGARGWQWVGPDGAVHPGGAVIDLAPASAGSATARLLAFDGQGRVVEATHTLHVSEGG